MNYKKMFFPIGGGDELEERLYGAMLVAKHFNINLEILKCETNPNKKILHSIQLPNKIQKEIESVLENKEIEEYKEFYTLFENIANNIDIKISTQAKENSASVYINRKEGYRSELVAKYSKYCDLVIAAAPPSGLHTQTFDAALTKSGKAVLMIPRKLKKFSCENIIIGWNNSPEASSAINLSLKLLQEAKTVHVISSEEYLENKNDINYLLDYLKDKGINASYKIVKTTNTPGEALLQEAIKGKFDLIVAGAYGHKRLKELMFGGASKYLLTHSSLPIFMSK
ncbi:MAG: universal stress protein [Campylobacterales bacterium]|nr:universal stress protein [Campylobacterales bacterium]NQY54835.1 universal stress protein [Campylobacteraceae bacterium]